MRPTDPKPTFLDLEEGDGKMPNKKKAIPDPPEENTTETPTNNPKKEKPSLTPIAVSVAQTAEILSLSESTVYNMTDDLRLPWVKVGTRKIILLKDIYDFLANARQDQKQKGD
jgi:excisionase family DNA binding protein